MGLKILQCNESDHHCHEQIRRLILHKDFPQSHGSMLIIWVFPVNLMIDKTLILPGRNEKILPQNFSSHHLVDAPVYPHNFSDHHSPLSAKHHEWQKGNDHGADKCGAEYFVKI
jgi:hypothetical protein